MLIISKILPCNNNSMYFEFTIEVYSTNGDIIAGAPWGAPNATIVFPK